MTDLDRLIAAVEAGTWNGQHFKAFPRTEGRFDASQAAWQAYRINDLNAALRLHDALLPGWWYRLTKGKHGQEAIVQGDLFAGEHAEASAENTARAWLLAILRALKARETA